MKKTLLLSVVASTMIMAGGDIAPVEPVVETPVVAAASGWDFSGQGVVYYQTMDGQTGSLFDNGQGTQTASHTNNEGYSQGAAGVQISAVNKNIWNGFGAGAEVSAISDLYLFPEVVSNFAQTANNTGITGDLLNNRMGAADSGAEITQAYLTYGIGNTSIKLGRQTLPKSLSPFAFSESWNVFKNTFDAALVVNTDISDTTLVFADVKAANSSLALGTFGQLNKNDGAYMLTAQNKSIDGLTLTGSYYFAPDFANNFGTANGGDVNIFWADAKFAISDLSVALQGGYIDADMTAGDKNTQAYGAKVGYDFGMFDAALAYSHVNDGSVAVVNFGGVKTPLYTQTILDQSSISLDSDTFKLSAAAKLLGGKLGAYYVYSDLGKASNGLATLMSGAYTPAQIASGNNAGTYQEFSVNYKTKLTDNITLFTAYVNQNDDRLVDDTQNFARVWARYNF